METAEPVSLKRGQGSGGEATATALAFFSARRLAAAFVLYGLVATAFLAINVPPYQNVDESEHFARAAHVADGGLVGTRFSTTWSYRSQHDWAGGAVDAALVPAWLPFGALMVDAETRATRAMWAPRIHWSGSREMLPFGAAAVYPPLLYAPSVIGVLVGRTARMTVVQTLVMSRVLTCLAAVSVGAWAIACAGGAAVWLFAVLTLPMSLSQIASISPDALMLACSGLAGALLVRALRWPSDQDGKVLTGLVVLLILVASARPPYGALAVLPLGLTKLRLRSRVLAAAAVAGCVMAWSAFAAATALTNFGALVGADPTAQMARLRNNPFLVVSVAWQTLAQYWHQYLEGFIGRLGSGTAARRGWGAVGLPPAYHAAAWAMLAVAALAAMLGFAGGERISIGSRLLIAAGLLLAAAGVFAIEYVTWTVPGGATVEGVQGRYFLPLALVGAALFPALGSARTARLHDALTALVVAFPVVSLAVVMRAVVLRYYLG